MVITIIEKMEVLVIVVTRSGHCCVIGVVLVVSGSVLGCFLAGSDGGD